MNCNLFYLEEKPSGTAVSRFAPVGSKDDIGIVFFMKSPSSH